MTVATGMIAGEALLGGLILPVMATLGAKSNMTSAGQLPCGHADSPNPCRALSKVRRYFGSMSLASSLAAELASGRLWRRRRMGCDFLLRCNKREHFAALVSGTKIRFERFTSSNLSKSHSMLWLDARGSHFSGSSSIAMELRVLPLSAARKSKSSLCLVRQDPGAFRARTRAVANEPHWRECA